MMYTSLAMQMTIRPFFVGDDLGDAILKLQNASKTFYKWFNDSQRKANPDKIHFICSSRVKASIMVQNKRISSSSCVLQ